MAFLVTEPGPVNLWYNIIAPQCTLQEQPEPGPPQALPAVVTGTGDAPFNLQVDQPLWVQFEWSQNGFLSGLALGGLLNFEVKFLFEAWGSGEAAPALDYTAVIPFQPGNGFVYNFGSAPLTRIVIPASTVPVGVYECMAVFQINFIGSGGQKYFAGYTKFPAINVYNATV